MKNCFYNAFTQVLIIGFLGFAGPGFFNAMQGMGKAGSDDPNVANAANGSLYICFAIVGYFSGMVFNMLGPKVCFSFGSLTYAIYAICIYFTKDTSGVWLPIIGGIILGCGAGLFWTSQAGLTLGYATANEKAKFSGLFWGIFQGGALLGGLIALGTNWNDDNGGAYPLNGSQLNTVGYWIFIVIMLCGFAASLVLLRNPSKVLKSDGTYPVIEKQKQTAMDEFKAAMSAVQEPFIWKMFIYFFYSNWYYAFQFTYLNSFSLNARSSGLNTTLYFLADIIAAQVLPKILDEKSWSIKKRGYVGTLTVVIMFTVNWVVSIVDVYTNVDGRIDKSNNNTNYDPFDIATALGTDGNEYDLTPTTVAWFPEQKEFTKFIESQDGSLKSAYEKDPGCIYLEFLAHTMHTKGTTPSQCKGGKINVDPDQKKIFGATCSGSGDQETCTIPCLFLTPRCARLSTKLTSEDFISLLPVIPELAAYALYRDSYKDNYAEGKFDISSSQGQLCDMMAGNTGSCVPFDRDYKKVISLPIVAYILSGATDGFMATYLMWLVGIMAGASIDKSVKYYALFKGTQSLGAGVSWVTNISASFLYRHQAITNIVMGALSLMGACFAVRDLPEREVSGAALTGTSTPSYSSDSSDDGKI